MASHIMIKNCLKMGIFIILSVRIQIYYQNSFENKLVSLEISNNDDVNDSDNHDGYGEDKITD